MALHSLRRTGERLAHGAKKVAQVAAYAVPLAAAAYAGYRWSHPRGPMQRAHVPQEMQLNSDQQLSQASLDIIERIRNGEL